LFSLVAIVTTRAELRGLTNYRIGMKHSYSNFFRKNCNYNFDGNFIETKP